MKGPGDISPAVKHAFQQVLGYLNFSSGAADPKVLAALNQLFAHADDGGSNQPLWRSVAGLLSHELEALATDSTAFQDSTQATVVLKLLPEVLVGYLEFHRDLLFHQTESGLFNSFFVGRALEAILKVGGPWEESERIVRGSIWVLNDFLGYRPVAALETQKIEPYAHEWVRPVPLYVRGAGAAYGPYRQVLEKALELLASTDEDILRDAHFDSAVVDELAYDPRAYDFDHPVNKRPNYHFGLWDPHQIDNQGRYRRFVVQQVTLDALMSRLGTATELPRDEVEFEAAAVLAGTILMAAGISGRGPGAHDSTVSLATLLPVIAQYRDRFYERLIQRPEAKHAERLRAEASLLRQPFGGARQHLNAELARRRASQLEHVHLARIFARMGFPDAATRQANVVPVAAARLACRIDCLLTSGLRDIDAGDLEEAVEVPARIRDLLDRGIACGALVDPWNILGFDCHFSLFPALENSVYDHRVDELVELAERLFAFYSRIWSEAAAVDRPDLSRRVDHEFKAAAEWWRQFAVHQVSGVESPDSGELYRAARHVAEALSLWHKGGASSGDLGFWSSHAEMFDAPKAYALVIDALLARGDAVASMSLLIHWLSQADRVPLEQGDCSFNLLAMRWMTQLTRQPASESVSADDPRPKNGPHSPWRLAQKFIDFLEANAEDYWQPPSFKLAGHSAGPRSGESSSASDSQLDELFHDAEDNPDVEGGLYGAAYDDVVYRDSTDDGVDGSIYDADNTTHDELTYESERIGDRLAFQQGLAQLWQLVAATPIFRDASVDPAVRAAALQRWIPQAAANTEALLTLLDQIREYRLLTPSGDHESMAEYDRQRLARESLLERVIVTAVEMADAHRLLLAARGANARLIPQPTEDQTRVAETEAGSQPAIEVLSGLLSGDLVAVQTHWEDLVSDLQRQRLLYVPLSKGGAPRAIVEARARQTMIEGLLAWLPRMGRIREACELIEVARDMERNNPVGSGAVTEFDDLFTVGYRAIVESMVESARTWTDDSATAPDERSDAPLADEPPADDRSADERSEHEEPASAEEFSTADRLVACLEQLTESLLKSWLAHSHTLRLSVLEQVEKVGEWRKLVAFIKKYGEQLFTQPFLYLSNIRAILHQGVDAWLRQLQTNPPAGMELRLLSDLDERIARNDACRRLSLILEAIIENYGEYRDYNSTTTQSDRGDSLFMLLDFLRLRAKYDRICWNLRPVILAHEILVRRGYEDAAKTWRRALTERIGGEADRYLAQLMELQRKYAMRMPTVADRLAERFIKPLSIDRMRALVAPAIEEARRGGPCPCFELLEHEAEVLTRNPTGAGLDVPGWIEALEEEVELQYGAAQHRIEELDLGNLIPLRALSMEEVQQQLDDWEETRPGQ